MGVWREADNITLYRHICSETSFRASELWYNKKVNWINQDMFRWSTVRIENLLSSSFVYKIGLKQGDTLSPLLFNFSLEYAIKEGTGN